jgi:hypothetical protein
MRTENIMAESEQTDLVNALIRVDRPVCSTPIISIRYGTTDDAGFCDNNNDDAGTVDRTFDDDDEEDRQLPI